MKIDIADAVRNEGEVYEQSYNGPFDSVEFVGQSYDFDGGVQVDATYFYDGEGISVAGSFQADVSVACSRCLKPFLYTVAFGFSEYYKEQSEDGVYEYKGDVVDLDQMLQDNVIMTLPGKFLCRQDCKGLCSHCGQDLNESECGCGSKVDEDNPFYSLSKLYDDEEV